MVTEAVWHGEKGEGFESTGLSSSVGFLIGQVCDLGQIVSWASLSFSLEPELIIPAESRLLKRTKVKQNHRY